MKQLVKTADPTSLPTVNYDRVIYNSETDNVIIKVVNDNGHPYVDLGLPSGLKWAKYNVGATSETDYGSYFQWGEIEPHSTGISYDWANYNYCNDSYNTLTKYNTNSSYGENLDGMSTLRSEDDAARAKMGGDWRMPTKDEIQELITYTDNEWVTNYNGTGIKGRKFTSKKNGNSIFIPASGRYMDSAFNDRGIYGYVWSSSLFTEVPKDAWGLYFYSGQVNANIYYGRNYGLPVRGVL